jgi:hypothetical protein
VIGGGSGFSGRALAMPMLVGEGLELVERMEQVPLVPGQRAAEDLAAADLHPPFHHRVHPGHPYPGQQYPDTRIGQDGVEQAGELALSVTDQETCR